MITVDGVRRRWKERKQYQSAFDWCLSLYDRMLRRTRAPLPFRGRICGIRLKANPHPFYMRLGSTDLLVLEELFLTGEYDGVLDANLKDVGVIVDLGSNAGFSLRLWSAAFPTATMIAVEPDPENAALCMRNSVAGGYADRVKLLQACVGAEARRTNLSRARGAWGYAMTEDAVEDGIAAEVLTMPQILAQTNTAGPISLLKCDVEGAECEIFRQSQDWIGRVETMVVELHPPYELPNLLEDLKRAGVCFPKVTPGKHESLVLLTHRQ